MLGQTASVKAWAAAAAAYLLLAGASGAVAQTAIDVPVQVFAPAQANSKPVVRWRPDAANWDRARADGPSFRVNVPVGAGAQAPVTVRFHPPEAQATEVDDTDAAAALDDDFIRDAQDQDGDFVRNAADR